MIYTYPKTIIYQHNQMDNGYLFKLILQSLNNTFYQTAFYIGTYCFLTTLSPVAIAANLTTELRPFNPFNNSTELLIKPTKDVTDSSSFDIDWSSVTTAYSPAIPIHDFLGDWETPLYNGDIAYAQARTSINVQNRESRFNYGLNWRYDYLMSFSKETAQMYWRYKNKTQPNQAKYYPLLLDASHNERIGTSVGYTSSINPSLTIAAKANIWKGLHSVDGTIYGQLTTQPATHTSSTVIESINHSDISIDYYYDKPLLHEERLNWTPDKPNGYGYSFDVAMNGQLGERTAYSIKAYDVLGRMFWKDMPSTSYRLDYDVDARPSYNLEGQFDTYNYTQALPWRIEGTLTHEPSYGNNWRIGGHVQANEINELYQLSAGYKFNNNQIPVRFTGLIEPQTDSFGLIIDSEYAGIKLLADNINFSDAKRAQVNIYGQFSW